MSCGAYSGNLQICTHVFLPERLDCTYQAIMNALAHVSLREVVGQLFSEFPAVLLHLSRPAQSTGGA